jgi:hypothetical protein
MFSQYAWNPLSTSIQSIALSVDELKLQTIAYILHSAPSLRYLRIKCCDESCSFEHDHATSNLLVVI